MTSKADFESHFDEILDAHDPDFEDKLLAAIDAKSGEIIEIATPQFNRTDGITIQYFPSTPDEYAALYTFARETLFKIGCQIWDESETTTHWLYPAEWYEHIPAGTPIIDISGEEELFVPGETDDDRRYGVLAYGFIQMRA